MYYISYNYVLYLLKIIIYNNIVIIINTVSADM